MITIIISQYQYLCIDSTTGGSRAGFTFLQQCTTYGLVVVVVVVVHRKIEAVSARAKAVSSGIEAV